MAPTPRPTNPTGKSLGTNGGFCPTTIHLGSWCPPRHIMHLGGLGGKTSHCNSDSRSVACGNLKTRPPSPGTSSRPGCWDWPWLLSLLLSTLATTSLLLILSARLPGPRGHQAGISVGSVRLLTDVKMPSPAQKTQLSPAAHGAVRT